MSSEAAARRWRLGLRCKHSVVVGKAFLWPHACSAPRLHPAERCCLNKNEGSLSQLPPCRGLCLLLGNPGKEIASCAMPALLRGRETVLTGLENKARIIKKKKMEECASYYLPTGYLLVLGALDSSGLYSKSRHLLT